jgi:hypothetical protein
MGGRARHTKLNGYSEVIGDWRETARRRPSWAAASTGRSHWYGNIAQDRDTGDVYYGTSARPSRRLGG